MAKLDTGECDKCSQAFHFELIHNGLNDSAFAYCEKCGMTFWRADEIKTFQTWCGFFFVILNNKKTGFYFLNTDIVELGGEIPAIKRQHSTAVYDFNFGGHFFEAASAYYLASALAASFSGRAFEPESGKWLDSKELQKAAHEMEAMGDSEKAVVE